MFKIIPSEYLNEGQFHLCVAFCDNKLPYIKIILKQVIKAIDSGKFDVLDSVTGLPVVKKKRKKRVNKK